jgi:glycosyltransferase involved in cell wall biosynthesis
VDLAVSLEDLGEDVEVACSAAGPLASELRARGIPVHVLTSSCVKRRVSVRYAIELGRLVRRLRPDVLHAHLYATAVAASGATTGTGIPLVVTEQTEAPWRDVRARVASRFAYRRARVIIAVSNPIRDLLVTEYGVPAARVEVIRNAVRPMPSYDGDRGTGRTVGTVARLHPEKGIECLLDAVPQIAAGVPDVRFVLVGEGPLRDELEAQARRLGVVDRVDFMGGREDARRLISGFDVLALPSLSEGTPLTIVEAMLAGVPVVASAVGGIPEQIEDRQTGLLVRPADVDALAGAVTQALTDATLRTRVTRAARARAEAEFSHHDMIERIAAVYARAARIPAATATASGASDRARRGGASARPDAPSH